MDHGITQADFIRTCFRTLLDDGEPHRYREILGYVQQQAQGTPFDGKFKANNIVQALKSLISSPDAEYTRKSHGTYQKCTPKMIIDNVAISEADSIYALLDHACDLQTQMDTAFNQLKEKLPEAQGLLQPDYQLAARCLDQSIDGISAWIAHIEDFTDGMVNAEDLGERPNEELKESPVMSIS